MVYVPGAAPAAPTSPTCQWFVFRDGMILVDAHGRPPVWSQVEAAAHVGEPGEAHYLGRLGDTECYAAELVGSLPPGYAPRPFREVIAVQDDLFFRVASQASQLLTWAANHRYCGRCGTATVRAAGERAMGCPSCGNQCFPRVSPAVIVAVLRGDEILLARAPRFPPGMYSVLAGFVEAGESLEDCVHREVREECGIEVTDLRYFGSQSWPFPHSLMVAYIAHYAAGDMSADPQELDDARWFRRENLPVLPLRVSIARRMIEWYQSGAPAPGRRPD
jgi:NAD+ diphosphatase